VVAGNAWVGPFKLPFMPRQADGGVTLELDIVVDVDNAKATINASVDSAHNYSYNISFINGSVSSRSKALLSGEAQSQQ